MTSKIYSQLAPLYSHLMRTIDYSVWADYIYSISKTVNKKNLSVLEIAGGNGIIAGKLKRKFKYYCVCDLSKQMLNLVDEKNIDRICCNMVALPFKNKFDFIFSTFDSVNYLTSKPKLQLLFNDISGCLKPNGLFTFDVSLERNSKTYQKYLNRKGSINGIKFIQKSFYDESKRIHYNYFKITLANGKKVEEIHKQKIYRFEDYFKIIDGSGFYVVSCKKAFTDKDASAETERAQFILKKKREVC
jgi:SAM-dependent methyltransferase